MTDILRLIVDIFQSVWPFRLVGPWAKGAVYVFGRYQGWVSPGCYPFVPFFMEIVPVTVVPSVWGGPLQTITLRDGRVLIFSPMVTLTVEDVNLAMNTVTEYTESCMEIVSGVLSEWLADADPDRFDPGTGKREVLVEELRLVADEETRVYGVRVERITFPNFALGVRTFRLLQDRATFAEAKIGV